MAGTDYYNLLGVRREATELEIKQAYRRMARKYHPDVNPGDKSAEERFKKINEAYEVLSNPEKRSKYDKYGDNWELGDQFARQGTDNGPQPRATWQQAPGWDFGNAANGGGAAGGAFEGVESVLDELLHGMRGGGARRRPRTGRGQDVETAVEITLEEAYQGTGRTVSLRAEEPCPQCQGTGRIGNVACATCRGAGVITRIRRLEVRIPAGVTTGSRVRIAGQGQPGFGGGLNGDLYLIITVKPHSTYDRRGDDLYVDVGIPLVVAMLGGEIQVPTLKGKLALRIPPETQNGRVFRLAGQGMPHLGNTTRGDLLAKVTVILPARLTPEEKELFRRLGEAAPGVGGIMSTETKGNINETEPHYVISVAARMLGVQVYTLRYYEKVGIVQPSRSKGNIRLYSDRDIAVMRRVKSLMDEMGINLAGAEVVLRMIQRMNELQGEVARLREEIKRFEEEGDES